MCFKFETFTGGIEAWVKKHGLSRIRPFYRVQDVLIVFKQICWLIEDLLTNFNFSLPCIRRMGRYLVTVNFIQKSVCTKVELFILFLCRKLFAQIVEYTSQPMLWIHVSILCV